MTVKSLSEMKGFLFLLYYIKLWSDYMKKLIFISLLIISFSTFANRIYTCPETLINSVPLPWEIYQGSLNGVLLHLVTVGVAGVAYCSYESAHTINKNFVVIWSGHLPERLQPSHSYRINGWKGTSCSPNGSPQFCPMEIRY